MMNIISSGIPCFNQCAIIDFAVDERVRVTTGLEQDDFAQPDPPNIQILSFSHNVGRQQTVRKKGDVSTNNVVYGPHNAREGGAAFKRASAKLFYLLLNCLSVLALILFTSADTTAANATNLSLLSDNHLRMSGTYNTSMLTIDTGATYTWLTNQPFITGKELIDTDNDDSNDGVGGLPDLTDGSDTQTDASMVVGSSTQYQGKYATVLFDLHDIYDIGAIDVWTIADSNRYMDGYEIQISTNGDDYTSLGYTVNENSRATNGMVNTLTSGITGKNARFIKIIMHSANDSEQLTVGEIAIRGGYPYDITLPINSTPKQVIVNTKLKNYSTLYLDWSDYNHIANDVNQYNLYIETEPFTNVENKTPIETITTGSIAQRAKTISYFALEPEMTYYIAITPFKKNGGERQDVTPQKLTTPGVIDTTGKFGNILSINDPAYGAGDYESHTDEKANMLMKVKRLEDIGEIQNNRWFNHDSYVMDQYGKHGIAFHLFYNDPSKLSFDNDNGVWSFSTYNEPDLAKRDVSEVTESIKVNHDALKYEDSRNMLFEPALSDTNTFGLSWLEDFYNADGQNGKLVRTYFDVMDVHPYCKHADPYPEGLVPGVPEALVDKIDTLRKLMETHGDGDKPIIFSELGWSTYTGKSYLRSIDEVTQRNYLVRAYIIAASKGIKSIFWHNFQDNGKDPTNLEHNFGIIDWEGAPKPAYYGYYILSRVLSNAVFKAPLANVSNPNYGYRFWDKTQGVYITSIWAADEADKTATFSTTDKSVKIVGTDGSLKYVKTNSGELVIPITGAPVFIYSTAVLTIDSIR